MFSFLLSMLRYTLTYTIRQPKHVVALTGMRPRISSSCGRCQVAGELPFWRGNHSRCLGTFKRVQSIFLWTVALLPYPQNQIIIKKRRKQLSYFPNSFFFFLSPSVFLPFKCILSAVHDHLENINNHFRAQMPSHGEFPNWVMLQSAAQNHTHSLGRPPGPAAETHRDSEVSNWEVCCFRKYLFCPPSNFPFAGIFHWS